LTDVLFATEASDVGIGVLYVLTDNSADDVTGNRLYNLSKALFRRNEAPCLLKLVFRDLKHDPLSFVADRIISHRGSPSRRQYLARWRNFGQDQDSWEPSDHFHDVQVIADHWSRQHITPPLSNSGRGNVVSVPPSTEAAPLPIPDPVLRRSLRFRLPTQ
jgi:hypothetical protein